MRTKEIGPLGHGFVGAVLAVVLWGGVCMGRTSDDGAAATDRPMSAPTVIAEGERSATNRLVDAGLMVVVEYGVNDDFEAGEVFEQRPSPGQEFEPGDTVTIVVAAE